MNKKMKFTDVEFMSAKDKELVLKDWTKFLNVLVLDDGSTKIDKYGNEIPILFPKFTKRLYEHLHLSCGYIAHYNRFGFFQTYFEGGDDTIAFCGAFIEQNQRWGSHKDYEDITGEMLKVLSDIKGKIYTKSGEQQKSADIAEAKHLLGKHGMTI